MKCKTCDKGLMLQMAESAAVVTITLSPVACDCCGGYFEDCENCKAGHKVIDWVSEEDYLAALERYSKAIGKAA